MGIENGICNNCGGELAIMRVSNEDGFVIIESTKCKKCGNASRKSLLPFC